MNSDRLRGEYLSALRATTFADLQPLFNAGVGAQAIAMADPAISRVTISGASYQLDPDGGIAWVIPVRVDDPVTPECVDPSEAVSEGAVIDLLAFHPSRPYRWALRVGAAEWLGAVEPQCMEPAAVRIWRSPLAWLRGGCDGLVLLSDDRRDQCRILLSLGTVIAEDLEHAAALRRILARPWVAPPVLVADQRGGRRHAV